MVIPSFVPSGERRARRRAHGGGRHPSEGGGAGLAPPTTPSASTCRLVDGRGSAEERERQPEIRDCFADVGSRQPEL